MLERLGERIFTPRFFYASLYVFFFASILLLLGHALGATTLWYSFYKVYIVLALAHTWYVFVLLALGDLRPRKYPAYQGGLITVIMPCYNEQPELLSRAVASVAKAEGVKQIVIVDDGSTNGMHNKLRELAFSYRVKLHFLERNQGKCAALHAAITRYVAESPYVVVMDSDTVIDPQALVRIVEPLQLGKIGAASGDVRILNERANQLTRMTAAYYWVALHMQRKAQSSLGMVGCCSGALAAYKSSIILAVVDEFVQEEFFGERCTYSDDRHLTNLVLRSGHDVVFVPEAVAYTYTPTTYRGFLRQQMRWRRGFFQEAIFGLTFMWKVKPLMFMEMLLWDFALSMLSFGIVLLVGAVT